MALDCVRHDIRFLGVSQDFPERAQVIKLPDCYPVGVYLDLVYRPPEVYPEPLGRAPGSGENIQGGLEPFLAVDSNPGPDIGRHRFFFVFPGEVAND